MSVERSPRTDGVRAIAGSFPRAGIRLDVTDPWGNSVAVISGSKTEHGPGGFEVPVWADAVFTLRFLNETFQLEVRHEIVILTFSEDENGSTDGPDKETETQSRLVTDWMELDVAEKFSGGLSRYEGVFSVEMQ